MGVRKTFRKRGGAVPAQKPNPMCQCQDPNTGTGCNKEAVGDSLFCATHQNCPLAPTNGYEPPYDPSKWGDPAIYKSMNCYAYFANAIDDKLVVECRKNNGKDCRQYFPQPGALNGQRNALNAEERRNCPMVEQLMMADIPNLKKSTFYDQCPAGTSKGALVSHKGEDYHFYRQDPDGYWSHKDGSNKIKQYDALKRKIANPQWASRDYRWQGSDLNYADFCGFYCVPRDQQVVLGQGGALPRRRKSRVSQDSQKTRKNSRRQTRKQGGRR